MTERFESLENGEVISVQHDTQVLSGHRTFRVGELSDAIKGHLEGAIPGWSEEKNGWFNSQGIDCEALRFGSNGWQKGRIRFCLEFCPDEPNQSAQMTSNSSIPTQVNQVNSTIPELIGHTVSIPTSTSSSAAIATPVSSGEALPTTIIPTTSPEITTNTQDPVAPTMPMAGIAAIGTVAVAAAVTTPDLLKNITDRSTPHLEDTILELEEHAHDPHISHSGNLDEIAFDFDLADGDRGRMIPNGMMELDLTDLSLDFSEHDLLNFDANGISNLAEEFANLQDLGQPENSGVLIDEVWNEMNQGNWHGTN